MKRIIRTCSPVVLCFVVVQSQLLWSNPDKAAKKDDAAQAAQQKPAEAELSLAGIIEAKTMCEISIETKQWSELSVLKAVPHGSRVKKGALLAALDTETIDDAIDAARRQLTASELELRKAQIAMKQKEAEFSHSMKAAERTCKNAQEDLRRFLKIDLPKAKEGAHHSVKRAEQSLAYELEELRQLEKMYKSDDLTEETEEIVLIRQRNQVENARYYLKNATIQCDETLTVTLPRKKIAMEEAARRANLAWEKARQSLPLSFKQEKMGFEKQERALGKEKEKLEELIADRKAMTVKAPVSGIVYYGRCRRGSWSGAASYASMLEPGGAIKPKSVIMTVVKPRPLFIRATIEEKNLHKIACGARGTAHAVGYPDCTFDVMVHHVETVPWTQGAFGAVLTASLPGEAEALIPGMKCEVKLTCQKKSNTNK